MARPRLAKEPRADLLRADTLTTAVTLITHDCQASSPDPLARLAAEHNTGQPARAIPPSWRPASPGLRTRIARARATTMTPAVQLRHATTLARPRQLPPRARAGTDPAISRAARLPDQIWPAWAIRLTDTGQVTATAFASSALIALLLPHSTLNLETGIIPLTGTPTSPDTIRNHLAMLARGPRGQAPLRILTELAFAIDDHQIPIDYARRRQLAATTELISDHAWKTITSSHPGQRAGHARRYLYELITGSNPSTAPAPYRPPSSDSHHSYRQFAALLHEPVTRALHDHALGLLRNAGITGEPLTWQPPVTWTTVTTWPGKDPDQTDPRRSTPRSSASGSPPSRQPKPPASPSSTSASSCAATPCPGPSARPAPGATRSPRSAPAAARPATLRTPHRGSLPHRPDWLRDEYITWQRSMPAIARQVGCHPATLTKFARASGIPLRAPGGSTRHIATTAPGHPASLPEPLRSALTGLKATQRLERFLHLASHHGISRTARDLHLSRGALGRQIAILERSCGGLFLRPARPPGSANSPRSENSYASRPPTTSAATSPRQDNDPPHTASPKKPTASPNTHAPSPGPNPRKQTHCPSIRPTRRPPNRQVHRIPTPPPLWTENPDDAPRHHFPCSGLRRPGQHDQRHRPYTTDAAGGSGPGHLRSQGATCPLLWANAEARPGSLSARVGYRTPAGALIAEGETRHGH